MKCKFNLISDNKYQCEVCLYIIETNKKVSTIVRTCGRMNLKEKIVSISVTSKDFIASGFAIADKEKRLEICRTCSEYDNGVCKFCTCNMSMKTLIESAKCPIGKW